MSQAALEAARVIAQRQRREIELQKFFDQMRKQQLSELRMSKQVGAPRRKILRKHKDFDTSLSVRYVNPPESDFGVKFNEEDRRIRNEVHAVLSKLSREGSIELEPRSSLPNAGILPLLQGQHVRAMSKSPKHNSKSPKDKSRGDTDRQGEDTWMPRLEFSDRPKFAPSLIPKIRPYKTKAPPGNPANTGKETDSKYFNEVLKKRQLNLALERRAALKEMAAKPSLSVDTRKVQGSAANQSKSPTNLKNEQPDSDSIDYEENSKDSVGKRSKENLDFSSKVVVTNTTSKAQLGRYPSKRDLFHRYIDDLHKQSLSIHQEREAEFQSMEKGSRATITTKSTRSRERDILVTSKIDIHTNYRHSHVVNEYPFKRVTPRARKLNDRSLQNEFLKLSRKNLIDSSTDLHKLSLGEQAATQEERPEVRVKPKRKHRLPGKESVDNSSADNIRDRVIIMKNSPKPSSKDYLNITLNSWRIGTPPDLDSPR